MSQVSGLVTNLLPGSLPDSPIRAEPLNSERLIEHAKYLAHSDKTDNSLVLRYPLLSRLNKNQAVLETIYHQFVSALKSGAVSLPPSAEWLLDNYYIIKGQIRQIRSDLSRGFYRKLPVLTSGPHQGLPRVYGLCYELLSHTDSLLDQDTIIDFTNAYQTISPLGSAELWAIPIMLRLILIENLHRLMEQSRSILNSHLSAKSWADSFLSLKKPTSAETLTFVTRLFQNPASPDPGFTIHFLQRIRDAGPAFAPAIRWVEERISHADINLEEFTRAQNHYQASNRISVGNSITTLRILNSLDWAVFFESTSLVERILRQDPSGIYPSMDFTTRDRYRHAIEELSRYSPHTEREIARRVIHLARLAQESSPESPSAHVGFYLIGPATRTLQLDVSYHPTTSKRFLSLVLTTPSLFYLSAIFFTTYLFTRFFFSYLHFLPNPFITFLLAIPGSVPAITLVNWIFTAIIPPSPPPKIDLKSGLPKSARTMVVIPCLASDVSGVDSLLENLEHRFLANRDEFLSFALLTDFADAPGEHAPQDEEILSTLTSGVIRLNAKYPSKSTYFYLFHRHRLYNPQEQIWMGWERKRGKLIEFNRLLRGSTTTSYSTQIGDTSVLSSVKYVITLDADTQLPLDTARRLIGAMLHPLNHPVIDPVSHKVTSGYAIIQPRVDVTAPAAAQSFFARTFITESGLDPYSSLISNVYQDLFGHAIFIGKGIYDVDAVLEVLDTRFPENTLLSHDLIEGTFARAGLASDIQLLEDFPKSYSTYSRRLHRWIRGDWQISPWLFPSVPTADKLSSPNPLSLISRWQIFDNLRRSLVTPITFLLLLSGWTILPGSPPGWTFVTLFCFLSPYLRSLLQALANHPPAEPFSAYLTAVYQDFYQIISRASFSLVFLPHQAFTSLHAITLALARLVYLKKGLLEWVSHASAERSTPNLSQSLSRSRSSLLVVFVLLPLIFFFFPASLTISLPFLAAWLLSPFMSYFTSRPLLKLPVPLPPDALSDLHETAGKIWRFFDETVTEHDHFLPPDNLQLEPSASLTHKTSPTNIGLYLLSSVSAYDLGFIDKSELYKHLHTCLATVEQLKRYRGHLFNWYNTNTLEPLHPLYVSSVDSGNLATALIALKQSCLEISRTPTSLSNLLLGLKSKLHLTRESLNHLSSPPVPSAHSLFSPSPSKSPLINLEPLIRPINTSITQSLATLNHLPSLPTLTSLTPLFDQLKLLTEQIASLIPNLNHDQSSHLHYWRGQLLSHLRYLRQNAPHHTKSSPLDPSFIDLSLRAEKIALEMDFSFLLNPDRLIFSTGFQILENRLDESYYDLLASESRLTSLLAVARKQVPQDHWFRLSRPLSRRNWDIFLLSWGGSMFEYLMPNLLARDYPNTLLSQTRQVIVSRQIEYARSRHVPWGMSESGFYAFDFQYRYQYRLFGVPHLGLKPDLGENLVVSPYATFLSLTTAPHPAWKNLVLLKSLGASNHYGFIEALDFTLSRIPKGSKYGPVHSHMAHHQGMSLISLNNYLNDNPFPRRFHTDPTIAAVELLLQERIPRHAPALDTPQSRQITSPEATEEAFLPRSFASPHTPLPRAHLLSNGLYSTVVTNSGSGVSRYLELDLTRWQPDPTLDNSGFYIYLKDTATNRLWSASFHPTRVNPDQHEVIFFPHKVQITRSDSHVETKTEIVVSPEKNCEIRRLTLTNNSSRPKTLELTSYTEIALDRRQAALSHPAFSQLFIESKFDTSLKALIFKRRPRTSPHPDQFAFHFLVADAALKTSPLTFETDRSKFIGRSSSPSHPQLLDKPLTQTEGTVLDPIASLRTRITLAPGQTCHLSFILGFAGSLRETTALVRDLSNPRQIDRTFELSQIHSQIELRHLGISSAEANLFQRLGSSLLFPDPILQAPAPLKSQNFKDQTGLFPHGISGDNPILLAKIKNPQNASFIKQLLLAHEYLRLKNLKFDLVILAQPPTTYLNPLLELIRSMIDTSLSRPWSGKSGGVFLFSSSNLSPEDEILFQSVARIIIDTDFGTLSDHLNLSSSLPVPPLPAASRRPSSPRPVENPVSPLSPPAGITGNSLAGFSPSGDEYQIYLRPGQTTPLPWSNILANPSFGSLVTESGLGFTFSANSQSQRLTPWSNDPLLDHSGEIIYLKDEDTGRVWSPTPKPIPSSTPFLIRHGKGYTIYEHTTSLLWEELTVMVSPHDPVKIMRLKLKNPGSAPLHLSATFFVEWVLGPDRVSTQSHLVTESDPISKAVFAFNSFNHFREQLAFASCSLPLTWSTSDRMQFLGRNGSYLLPQALRPHTPSSPTRRFGANLDPAACLHTRFTLEPGSETTLVFLVGSTSSRAVARDLIAKYGKPKEAETTLAALSPFWRRLIRPFAIKTPDRQLNLLVNHWLLYQTLSSRFWSRTGYYQASGAFGFRDQLQDCLALIYSAPHLVRDHLLVCATHQFPEGDVLHWWQPHTHTGIRTRASDDYLWLPYVTADYVTATGDWDILDEAVPFAILPALAPTQTEHYGTPQFTSDSFSLYEHCVRALRHALRFGSHHLPLIGTGDWNDGLNNVGAEGRGESIWLGWFLYSNLTTFAPICDRRRDPETAALFRRTAKELKNSLDKHGWDGEWFRRAYFDSGRPLGSRDNKECFIDSLSQSWAAISGAGSPEKTSLALKSAHKHLVKSRQSLVLLLTPPFVSPSPFPGYIQSYPPGIRENGGQYTHAAIWLAMAFAISGHADTAWQILRLINPTANRTLSQIRRYQVEPYVLAADVYFHPQHLGRGGWTWYTGSSAWYYRTVIDSLLGLKLEADHLVLAPHVPPSWNSYHVTFTYHETRYEITVRNPHRGSSDVKEIYLDRTPLPDSRIPLVNDSRTHHVVAILQPPVHHPPT